MKKIFYGSIALCMFATAIILIEVSCQKTIGQSSGPASDDNASYILYEKVNEVKVPVVTQTDSGAITSYLTYFAADYSISNLNGNNEIKISINLPDNLYAAGGGMFTADGKSVVFNVFTKPTASNNSPQQCYIYSCAVDGSDLKKIRDNCGFSDVH